MVARIDKPIAEVAPDEEPLTVSNDTAAALLGVHFNTMKNWLKAGIIPSVVIGGRRLIPYAALKSMVETSQYQRFAYSERGEATKQRNIERASKRRAAAEARDNHTEAAD